jgi:glutamyl-Q tRNA(Asp) synthetase
MITRFAPSPTGPLHLGHAFAALIAHDMARAAGGQFLLRIEDLDQSRCRPQWEQQIVADLHWLGLNWPEPVLRQSARQPAYDAALEILWQRGLLYPCSCARRDIEAAASAPQEGVSQTGPDGPLYPGTCRHKPRPALRPRRQALRLDLELALGQTPGPLQFVETGENPGTIRCDPARFGDVVLARREIGSSYHLAVVLDDAAQGITHVTRGADLQEATGIHILLQRLLGLPQPVYHHHRLIRDSAGKRLAKRDDARALATYRAAGVSPAGIRALVGL